VSGDATFAAELVRENEGGRLLRLERAAPQLPEPAGVRVRRIHEPVTEQDGIRVLVDRLWPRGMSKDKAQIDEWFRDVAPSTALRRWYAHDPQRFTEFRRRYQRELAAGEQAAALLHLAELAKGRPLTLLTASRDPATSEAVVLAELLEDRPPTPAFRTGSRNTVAVPDPTSPAPRYGRARRAWP
jgi:uncharacterized protein YeaO (DUF488 family)